MDKVLVCDRGLFLYRGATDSTRTEKRKFKSESERCKKEIAYTRLDIFECKMSST